MAGRLPFGTKDRGGRRGPSWPRPDAPPPSPGVDQGWESRGLPWTAGLGVPGWATARAIGLETVGPVAGFAHYRLGRTTVTGLESIELPGPTEVLHALWQAALARLRRGAERLGADGVVAVRLHVRKGRWAGGVVESSAAGTAVRVHGAPGLGPPFVAAVGATDLAKLMAVGYRPAGIALGASVAYVYTDGHTQRQRVSTHSQELGALTREVYAARRRAMERLTEQGAGCGAEGVVAVNAYLRVTPVDRTRDPIGGDRTDHVVEFAAVGTAVVRDARPAAGGPVGAVLTLTGAPVAEGPQPPPGRPPASVVRLRFRMPPPPR